MTTANVQQGVTRVEVDATGTAAFLVGANPNNDPRVGIEVLKGDNTQIGITQGARWNGPMLSNPDIDSSFRCVREGILRPGATFNSSTSTSSYGGNLPTGSELTQAEVDDMRVRVFRSSSDTRATRLYTLTTRVTYVTYSNLVQTAYRIYSNANNAVPGTPLAASNTRAEVNVQDGANKPFRVRMNVQSQQERWLQNYGSYKLQYAQKAHNATCSGASGWSDVGSSGKVRWNANAGVANGTILTNANLANDPETPSSVNVYQTYRSANTFSKVSQVDNGASALWDFSLQLVGAQPGEAFCLRIAANDGTNPMHSYQQYPEILATGGLSLSVVDAGGSIVTNPQVAFPLAYATTACQNSSAPFGVPAQKLRVRDDRSGGNWSLSIAATGGPAAEWSSASGSYSFNNAAGTPAGCQNGQLSMDFSSALTTPAMGGCSANNITPGVSSAFTGGTALTLASSASADRFCGWDFTGITLNQAIPGATPTGEYSLDTTVTLLAL